ncbi:MAG: DUF6175 family protein [Prevotellaceae bacterium]|jgi:hypothetical protein|nr:DUF6175 family protein [Prevotellaceae bacterium]
MKKSIGRIILLCALLLGGSATAQDAYSTDVTCTSIDTDKWIATIEASAIADKKKEAPLLALKSIFNALFHSGVAGVLDGRALMTGNNDHYNRSFFSSRYHLYVIDYTESGDKPQKIQGGMYKSRITARIQIKSLIQDLVDNKIGEWPPEMKPIEKIEEEIRLPSIMVVPYKGNTQLSYADILKNDFDLRMATSQVSNGFAQEGVHVINPEALVDAIERAGGFTANDADSNDRQLLMNSGADVYVIVDLKKEISPRQNSRVALIMSARELATGRELANRSGWTPSQRTTDLAKLCAYAARLVLKDFLKDISTAFAQRAEKGNTIVLRIGLADGALNTLESRVGGNLTIAAQIRNWVRKNAKTYHLQGSVAEALTFDTVQIPAKDTDGLPLDAATFGDNLVYFLEGVGVTSTVRIDGNTVYITIQ